MITAGSGRQERQASGSRSLAERRQRLIRQASVWLPGPAAQPARLQELEELEAIRWVDLYGGVLRDSEAQALLNPVCRGELTPRMVRDLITAGPLPRRRSYDAGRIAITSAFRTGISRRTAA